MRKLVYECTMVNGQKFDTTSLMIAKGIVAEGGSYEIKFVKIQNLNEEVYYNVKRI